MIHLPLVEVTRGNITESVHYGSFSIAFGNQETVRNFGDDQGLFYLRSAAKPFQALSFLESGGAETYGLDSAEIAIMCASHSGTDQHVETLIRLHQKLGLKEDMLQCGTHMPFHRPTTLLMQKAGEDPRPYQSDCSGKHSAMLAFARMISAPVENYLSLDHPVQQRIITTFSEMCDYDPACIAFGVDGCSAPVFAIPLPNAALAYARLLQPDKLRENRAAACRLITASMAAQPDMVAGPGRFDTDFMRTAEGKAISKIGAEGYQAIGVFPEANPHGNGSIGITIKIADGDHGRRAASVVAIAILEHLGILDAQQVADLHRYYLRSVLNWKGDAVGQIRSTRTLLDLLDRLS